LEGNKYHASTDTIRFEGDVVLFSSSASKLSDILPFVSKATVVSAPFLFVSRNASSPSRFHVQLLADSPALHWRSAVSRIRASGAKFAPVVSLMNCSDDDLDLMFRDASVQNALMTDIVALLRTLSADGAILDFYSCLGRERALGVKSQMHRVVAFLGSSMLRKKMISILSVPPIKGSAVVDAQLFAARDFETLEYSFSFFHVLFCAHALPSNSTTAAARAPLAWIIKSVRAMLPSGSVKTKRAGKLVASIDLRAAVFDRHGNGWHVDGDGLVNLLLNHTGRCMWDGDSMEHSCASLRCPSFPPLCLCHPNFVHSGTYSDRGQRHEVFLPSLRGLQVCNSLMSCRITIQHIAVVVSGA
jgi:hypothetical protein